VEATISDTSLLVGDILTVSVVAVATVDGQIDVQVPPIDGLTELSRSRSEGTSISWTNAGQAITRELTVHIEFSAERVGKIEIPPIVARVGSVTAESKASSIEVRGGKDPVVAPAGAIAPPEGEERTLFVRYRLDRSSAHLGQQVLLDLEIFSQPGQGFSVEEIGRPPELDGFWKEVVDQPQRLTRRNEMIGGRRYDAYRVWRVALFPLEAGGKLIPPTSVTFSTGRSLFASGRRIRRHALALELDVKPLPIEGRPDGFSNTNVGVYQMSASVDHSSVPAGKAVLLRIEVSGSGNVENLRMPELTAIDGFRVFPPTTAHAKETGLAGIRGMKSAEILLMPERGGRLEIPSIVLPVFNPEKNQYDRLSTESIRIAVEGDPAAEGPRTIATLDPQLPRRDERVARASLRPLRFVSRLERDHAPPWRRPTFLFALAFPPIAFVLAILGELAVARARRDTPSSRKKAASRAARTRLERARAAADRGAAAEAYAELVEAVSELGSTKCGVPLRGLTVDEVGKALSDKGAPGDLVEMVTKELLAADFARFAPGTAAVDGAHLDRWADLLERIDTWRPLEVEG
jgi:hypothetical protein